MVYEPLAFSQFPVQSYVITSSASSLTTDSSAGATAMATGFKTDNHVVSMDPTLSFNYKTLAEKAKEEDYKIGILSSVTIDHATPAGFYAHQKSRNEYDEIALQIPTSNFDFFGGGGVHNLGAKDDVNSVAHKLDKFGYKYLTTEKEIKKLKKGASKIVAVNPGTYSGREFYWEIDKNPKSMSLAYFTKKGIEILDNKKGFFMMIEGGKIDWALHSNDLATAIYETIALDDAVKEAIKFYNNHKEETLIIVTSDHETGGLALGNNAGGGLKLEVLKNQKISAQEFERTLTELKDLERKVSFEEVLDSVKVNFGLGNKEKGLELNKSETKWLLDAYVNEFVSLNEINPDRDYLDQYSDKPFTLRVITILNTKAGIAWSTEGHTANKVPVKVLGAGQEYFQSTIDNTDIHDIIIKMMQISDQK
jgi:alkaline phosphatase